MARKLIDDKGRAFGKINIIDLLVIIVLVMASAVIPYGCKLSKRKAVIPAEPAPTHYSITRRCPNCEATVGISVPLGEEVKGIYTKTCSFCKCEVELQKRDGLSWQEKYYKSMVEKSR